MNIERAILIAFLGNYLINNVVAALVALIPPGANKILFTIPGRVDAQTGLPNDFNVTVQYVVFILLAAALVALITWWYYRKSSGRASWKGAAIFGALGFAVAIATAFVSGIAGVILNTGSLSQAIGVLPNFWPFFASGSTIVLLAYWILPAAGLGWYLAREKSVSAIPPGTPKPVF